MHGGCHGGGERSVNAELCEIVDEIVEMIKVEMIKSGGKPFPPAAAGNGVAAARIGSIARLQAAA
jgi:hypothetical protein